MTTDTAMTDPATFTLIDVNGMQAGTISVTSVDLLTLNTPEGFTAIPGTAPSALSYWNMQAAPAGAWLEMPAQPSPASTWNAVTKVWEDLRTLADVQASQWAVVKAARDATNASGFVWDGSNFDSNADAQTRIIGAIQMAQIIGAAFSIDWTLQDSSVRTLSSADMVAVGMAMGAFMQGVFGKGRDLYTAINAATTIAGVEAIVWTYP